MLENRLIKELRPPGNVRLRKLDERASTVLRPVQTDLPIWMGYAGPQGARRAGLLGAGLLLLAWRWDAVHSAIAATPPSSMATCRVCLSASRPRRTTCLNTRPALNRRRQAQAYDRDGGDRKSVV